MKLDKKNIAIISGFVLISIILICLILPRNNNSNSNDLIYLPIESIQFTDNLVNLKKGDKYQLDVEILPINHIKEEIYYFVDNEDIANVSKGGVVTSLKEGITTITATTASGITTNLELVITENSIVYIEPSIVDVEKIILDNNNIILQTGSSYQLNYKIEPNNANINDIYWETNDARTATITDQGLISARTEGNTILTAYYNEKKLATVNVRVNTFDLNLTDIELNPNELTISKGDNYQLLVNYLPNNIINKKTTWKSSNNNVVKVNDNGLLTAVNIGSATITATCNGISKNSIVNVLENENIIEIISVNFIDKNVELNVGDTYKLNLNYLPNNATNNNFTWTSNNTNIAKVSSSGIVTALKEGEVIINARTVNGKEDSIKIKINKKVIENNNNLNNNNSNNNQNSDNQNINGSNNNNQNTNNPNNNTSNVNPKEVILNINKINLKPGQSKQLKATILPLNASQSVTWVSGSDEVATISNKGLLIAKNPGTTTISVITKNGLVAKTTVTVKYNYPDISPQTAATVMAPGESISNEMVQKINEHLNFYINDAPNKSNMKGINPNRAKVLAAAYFLTYNPYYKVSYNFVGKDSIGLGWFRKWGNSTNDPKYPVKGIDCIAFIRWSFYQVYNKDIGSIGGSMRIRDNSGLRVGDIAATAQPGDVLRKDKNLMGGTSGHVAFVYSVNKQNGTIVIIHAAGSRAGVTATAYNDSNSRTNFNYLYDMNYIYGG